MTSCPNWLSISDLSRTHGISPLHCDRVLREKGWRDKNGRPTQTALNNGAAINKGHQKRPLQVLWNAKACEEILLKSQRSTNTRNLQIHQWANLLEMLEEGSPSINETAEQMAKEIPNELIEDINNQLANSTCRFRISPNNHHRNS